MTAPNYRFVLDEDAFAAFVELEEAERDLAGSYFRWLAANPNSKGSGFHDDSTGRPNYASLCGPFLIVHWTDHAMREVRLVKIYRD